jgi:hypothetical protein
MMRVLVIRAAVMALLAATGGCTYADRNKLAVGVCERTAGCTVTDERERRGPLQVQAMEHPRKAKTTER